MTVTAEDVLGSRTLYQYDADGNLASTTDALGNVTTNTYDIYGNVTSVTDPLGNTTSYQYNARDQLTCAVLPSGSTTTYFYDNAGNLTAQEDGLGHRIRYTYNARNLKNSRQDTGSADEENFAAPKETYLYTADGLIASKTDRNGIATTYTYDGLGRLITEQADSDQKQYTYDILGNVLTTTDSTLRNTKPTAAVWENSTTTTRSYDAEDRVLTKEVSGIGTVSYEYDLFLGNGSLGERSVAPDGSTTETRYDAAGRIASILTDGTEIVHYTYNANGSRQAVIYADGTREDYIYDAASRVTLLIHTDRAGTVLDRYEYQYDAAGNLLLEKNARGTTTYTYDVDGKLLSAAEPDGMFTKYTYDAAGNRASKEETTPSGSRQETIYKYDASNRLQKEVYRDKIIEYTYDNNGNLLYQETNSTEAAAVFGAVAEVVSQKLFEKKEKIDWKAVAYEAVVGGVSAAVGGVIGKKLASKTTGSATKKIVKSAVAAGVSESSSGFATDVGKQIFVEDKKLDEVDYGQAAKTASIAGIAGIAGAILGAYKECISGYRLETKQRKVKRYSVRYQCFNAIENCPNHPNYPVVTGVREQMETYQEWVYVGKEYVDDLADSTKKGITKAAKSTETVKKAAEKKAVSTIQDGAAETVTKKESLLDRVKKWWEESTKESGEKNKSRKADFYVTPKGDVVPSTGYRYCSANNLAVQTAKDGYIEATNKGMYFSFDKIDDSIIAQGKLQIPYRPEYRISFDTLDIIDDIHIPKGDWGKADYLEPITKDFKKFGPGKATQAITYSTINFIIEIFKLR